MIAPLPLSPHQSLCSSPASAPYFSASHAGTPLEPLGVLSAESDGIVLPEGAWEQEKLLSCLTEVATSNDIGSDIAPSPDASEGEAPELIIC